jgi:hypothetical protein
MIGLEPFLWVAGALHGLIAVRNLAAARLYRYREEMAKMSPFVREVFYVQNAYIKATVGALGLACLRFAPDLAGWRSGRPVFGGTPTGAVAIPLAGALHLAQPWSSGRLAVGEAAAVDPAPVTAWPRRQIALDLGPGRALRGPKDRARDERQVSDPAGVRPVMAQPLRQVGIDRSRGAKALFHRVRAVSWAGFESQCLGCALRSDRPRRVGPKQATPWRTGSDPRHSETRSSGGAGRRPGGMARPCDIERPWEKARASGRPGVVPDTVGRSVAPSCAAPP